MIGYNIMVKLDRKPTENGGEYCERIALAQLLNRFEYVKNSIPFDEGSDIEELHMSVKSKSFTLATNLNGDSLADMVQDYFDRTASTTWCYVSLDLNKLFIMDKAEFSYLLHTYGTVDRVSAKRGGRTKVRVKRETQSLQRWLLTTAGLV